MSERSPVGGISVPWASKFAELRATRTLTRQTMQWGTSSTVGWLRATPTRSQAAKQHQGSEFRADLMAAVMSGGPTFPSQPHRQVSSRLAEADGCLGVPPLRRSGPRGVAGGEPGIWKSVRPENGRSRAWHLPRWRAQEMSRRKEGVAE